MTGASGGSKPGSQCGSFADVVSKTNPSYLQRFAGRELLDDLPRPINAAIVDEDNLVTPADRNVTGDPISKFG